MFVLAILQELYIKRLNSKPWNYIGTDILRSLIFSSEELGKKVRAAGIRTQHNEAVCYFKDTSEPNLALGSELRLGLFPYKFLLVTPWYQEPRLV